jgi:acetate kinase
LALEVYVSSIRHYLGAYIVELGGVDAIVFTGGIGENGSDIRTQVCAGLEELGIQLDADLNNSASGETKINTADSRTSIWVVPTNEEIVVARKSWALLNP